MTVIEQLDPYALRLQDFSLSEEQSALQDSYRKFFARHSPADVVRAAEPVGYDETLWHRLVETGITTMALPEAAGGDGASMLDIVVIAEELGRALAPVPMISHIVASNLIARAGAHTELAEHINGRPVTVALNPVRRGAPQLVPESAIAADVVALSGDRIELHRNDKPAAHVANLGSTPLAWWTPGQSPSALGDSAAGAVDWHHRAVDEWRVLTAAALVGLTEAALSLGVEFAKTRETMGVPIGALQGVSFSLADVEIGVAGARNLARRAAWMMDHEPLNRPDLPTVAYSYCSRVATHGVSAAQHVQGGLGFTVEADISLYFLRAKGWSVLGGELAGHPARIGAMLLAAQGPAAQEDVQKPFRST
jgi:alkylation response protein AidB-like acyl-CoA dehydrogenase